MIPPELQAAAQLLDCRLRMRNFSDAGPSYDWVDPVNGREARQWWGSAKAALEDCTRYKHTDKGYVSTGRDYTGAEGY